MKIMDASGERGPGRPLIATPIRIGAATIVLATLLALVGFVVGSAPAAAGVATIAHNGGVTSSPAATVAVPETVVIRNFAFVPSSLTVAPGATITVTNQDRAPHTMTARNRAFDSGTISGGQSGQITAPRTPGTYPYFCTIHPSMTGVLIVR